MNREILRRHYANADEFVGALFGYLQSRGSASYFDSEVTQLEHGLQSASLACEAGAPKPLIAAALLHDIGHLLLGEQHGDPDFLASDLGHEKAGAALLARWFAPAVAVPVALHVSAKRYLVAADPGYRNALSPMSRQSLAAQGGPFSPADAKEFARMAFAQDALSLRQWDDRAKVTAQIVPPLEHYFALVSGLVIVPENTAGAEPPVRVGSTLS